MAPGKPQKIWRTISIEQTLSISGGYQTKSWALDSQQVKMQSGATLTMAKVNKHADWFIKLLKGHLGRRDETKRLKVIDDLKRVWQRCYDDPLNAAVAVNNDDGEEDPMDELADPNQQTSVEMLAQKKKHRRVCKTRLIQLQFPKVPPGPWPSNKEKHNPWVMVTSKQQMYVAIQDMEWLMTYASMEMNYGNVTMEVENDVLNCNCEIEGLQVKWDWNTGSSWNAEFVSGPLNGTKYSSSVLALTGAKWAKASDGRAVFGDSFETANYEQKRASSLEHLKMHCREQLLEVAAVADVEAA